MNDGLQLLRVCSRSEAADSGRATNVVIPRPGHAVNFFHTSGCRAEESTVGIAGRQTRQPALNSRARLGRTGSVPGRGGGPPAAADSRFLSRVDHPRPRLDQSQPAREYLRRRRGTALAARRGRRGEASLRALRLAFRGPLCAGSARRPTPCRTGWLLRRLGAREDRRAARSILPQRKLQ